MNSLYVELSALGQGGLISCMISGILLQFYLVSTADLKVRNIKSPATTDGLLYFGKKNTVLNELSEDRCSILNLLGRAEIVQLCCSERLYRNFACCYRTIWKFCRESQKL